MKRTKWTTEQDNKLRELYPRTLTRDIAKELGLRICQVQNRAYTLKLNKDKDFLVEVSRQVALDPNHGGRKTQFKKGSKPPNKGKKREEFLSAEAIERVKQTQFQKGNKPANWRPLGSERITRDGYIEVKVRDKQGNRNWELKHRWIYIQNFGLIPKNHVVVFKNGNITNFELNNLELISKEENMKRNTIHNLHPEIVGNIYLMKSINSRIKQSEKK